MTYISRTNSWTAWSQEKKKRFLQELKKRGHLVRVLATYRKELPLPHEKQRDVLHSRAKRKVICAGRRGGKTTLAAMVAVDRAMSGQRVLLAAPTQEQTDAFWEKCKEWLAQPLEENLVYKNEQRHLIEIPDRGRIRAKTAWNADTLRGDYADFLILDEYAMMDSSAWDLVGAPMLLDNDGEAWFISTPRRKNHFYSHYVRALQDDSGRWGCWTFTSHDNPHLSQAALAEITGDLTEEAYKQEIMAEFLENEGAVFRNIQACMIAKEGKPKAHFGHKIVCGVDWGRQNDYTAISIVCADCREELAHDRFNKIDYEFQRDRLKVLLDKWHVSLLMPELNSIGQPIVDRLAREDVCRMDPFTMTISSKPQLIQSLAIALERQECLWLPSPIWSAELESYEMTTDPNTGRPRYSAPSGVHDDTVIARALAWRAATYYPKVTRMMSTYEPLVSKEIIAWSKHANTTAHRKWAHKHFCKQCYEEYYGKDAPPQWGPMWN